MCMRSAPKYSPPPPPQEARAPEGGDAARRRSSSPGAMAASTLLTGPSGIDAAKLRLGKNSLLGG